MAAGRVIVEWESTPKLFARTSNPWFKADKSTFSPEILSKIDPLVSLTILLTDTEGQLRQTVSSLSLFSLSILVLNLRAIVDGIQAFYLLQFYLCTPV